MLIKELGEFGLLERITRRIKNDSSVIKGPGDDCAVIKFNRDKYLLATADMITQGVDFTDRDNPYLVGRKALAASISDIAACGGLPRYCLVSLGLPRNSSVGLADKICKGIADLAAIYKINIVGGDLSRVDKLTIDVSMLGLVEKGSLVLRSGAKIGDIIFVSGALGGSIFGRHLRFIPRVKEARFLVKKFKVNSMIDISDGLVQDLGHILEESEAGAVIYAEAIPLSKDARGLTDALYMGEDFELLFTLPRSEAKKIVSLKKGSPFRPIGEITAKGYGLKIIDKRGKEKSLKPGGFLHF